MKQIEEHKQKIENPEKAKKWSSMTQKAKKGLLKKWEKDKIRNAEEALIEIMIWERKYKWTK